MPSPRSPWSAAMVDELDRTGDWVPVEHLLALAAAAVPPGRAIQHREMVRRSKQRAHVPVSTRAPGPKPTTDEDRIRYGARQLATRALHQLVRSGHAERDGDRVRRAS